MHACTHTLNCYSNWLPDRRQENTLPLWPPTSQTPHPPLTGSPTSQTPPPTYRISHITNTTTHLQDLPHHKHHHPLTVSPISQTQPLLTWLVTVAFRGRWAQVTEDVTRHHVPHDDLSVVAGGGQQVGQTVSHGQHIFFVAVTLKHTTSFHHHGLPWPACLPLWPSHWNTQHHFTIMACHGQHVLIVAITLKHTIYSTIHTIVCTGCIPILTTALMLLRM